MKKNYSMYLAVANAMATTNTEPSETDQTGADDTDINVIVKRYGVYGTVPSGMKQPMYGQDTSEWPTDLAQAMETARALNRLRSNLPEPLRGMSDDELMSLTPEKIVDILKPVDPPKVDEPKEPTT